VRPISLGDVPYSKVDGVSAKPLARLELIQEASMRAQLVPQRTVVDAYPVSALQESLLASSLKGEETYLYQRVYDVRHLDLRRLELAFRTLFHMNDTLRSTFNTHGPRMYQVIRNDFTFPWSESNADLTDFKAADKQVGVTFGQPFVRFTVLSRQILVVSMHHALFDFWSHKFLYEGVAKLYHGQTPAISPSWGLYVRYLQQLDQGVLQQFWTQYMHELEPTLLNYTPTLPTHQVTRRIAFNPKATSAGVIATTGTIIYSAWALVLSQHVGASDVVFATAISGRDAPLDDIDRLDGPTLTIVPQRVKFDPRDKLVDLIKATSTGLWQLNKHAQYGMRNALKAANSRNDKLFDTFVNILVRNATPEDLAEDMFYPHGSMPMWETGYTTLQAEEDSGYLNLKLIANMEPQYVRFVLDQLVSAIRIIMESPDTVVSSVDLIGPAEREALTHRAQPLPLKPRLLHSSLEKIAREQPQRPALQWQTERVYSYAELDELANRMASFLFKNGLRKGDLIPLLLEKSPTMIIAILAVLKLGAAYVPMSPENPVERNAYITQQVNAKRVLTEKAFKDCFKEHQIPVLLMDELNLNAYAPNFAAGRVDPAELAYIIFTSGSTGMPKGVQVSHSAASAFADSMNDFLNNEDDASTYRTLQFSNYVFDVSVYDIFTTLSSGSTLCMAPTERLLSKLATVITEMGVTHCFLTPTVVKLLQPSDVPTLATLSVGGEPMSADIIDTWVDEVRLINGYGPTEASVIVSSYDIKPHTMTRNIGQPLGKMSAAILDPKSDKMLPYGGVGEVCFIGPQLAHGYYKDEEKTEASFYKPSIPGLPRMYRSGDLARWLPNGELECLGRKDSQVKINGFRIELGEIEASLLRTGAVFDTAVVVADIKKKPQLIAFVVFEPADDPGILPLDGLGEVIAKMKAGLDTLTPYMFPRIVLPLAMMPKMPSGKVDRKKLKKLADTLTDKQKKTYAFAAIGNVDAERLLPLVNDRQRLLAEAWTEVLDLDTEFGQDSDFFRIGGDSIAAINLTSTLRSKGFRIKVGEIMAASKLSAMSEVMTAEEVDGAAMVAFEPVEQVVSTFSKCEYESIYPCPPGQAEFLECGSRPESFWTLTATRKLATVTGIIEWVELIRKLTEANEILRTTFAKIEGRWYGAVLRDSTPDVEVHEVRDIAHKRETINSVEGSNFAVGKPFIRYVILRSPDGTLEVCIKLDHGVYDGTLLRICSDQCAAIAHNKLPPKSTDFKDFALHEWRSDHTQAMSFWLKEQRRPTGYKYPPSQSPSITSTIVHMCPTPLEAFTKQNTVSASVIYQAAFTLWLSRRSRSLDVSYDYLYTGRNVAIANPQSINGTCANFLPLRMQLPAVGSSQTGKDFVNGVQAEFWSATENGNVGLEDIYAAAATSRALSGNNALFLFQPFEVPPAKPSAASADATPQSDHKWIVMALSEVRMRQPYALVCEVIRTSGEAHKLRLGYDQTVFSAEEADVAAKEIGELVDRLVDDFEDKVTDVLA